MSFTGTVSERRSLINFGSPFETVLPEPDGDITKHDRLIRIGQPNSLLGHADPAHNGVSTRLETLPVYDGFSTWESENPTVERRTMMDAGFIYATTLPDPDGDLDSQDYLSFLALLPEVSESPVDRRALIDGGFIYPTILPRADGELDNQDYLTFLALMSSPGAVPRSSLMKFITGRISLINFAIPYTSLLPLPSGEIQQPQKMALSAQLAANPAWAPLDGNENGAETPDIPLCYKITDPTRPRPITRANVFVTDTWPVDVTTLDNFALAWASEPNLFCESLNWSVAPSASTCELSYTYGRGIPLGETAFKTVSPFDFNLHDWVMVELGLPAVAAIVNPTNYEQIVSALNLDLSISYNNARLALVDTLGVGSEDEIPIALAQAKTPRRWFGSIEIEADRSGGLIDGVATGDQRIVAYGIELLLSRTPVNTSKWIYDTDASAFDAESGAVINGLRSGRAPNKLEGEFFYRYQDPAKGGVAWSTRTAVEMLVRTTKVVSKPDGALSGLEFAIDDADLAKLDDSDRPEIDTENVTLDRLLGALIARQRLHNWWVDVDLDELSPWFGKPRIYIATSTESSLSLPTGFSTPRAASRICLDYTQSISSAIRQTDGTAIYDRVRCIGGRRRYIRSDQLGASESPFDAAWQSGEQSDYETGAEGLTDWPANANELRERRELTAEYRGKENLEHVFSQFDLSGQIETDTGIKLPPTVRLLNGVPLFRGSNYSVNPPTHENAATSNTIEEQLPAYAIAKIPSKSAYVFSEQMGVGIFEWEDEENKKEFSVRIAIRPDDQQLWLKVHGAPQHAIAYGDFTAQSYDQQVFGQWSWRDMEVVWCYESNGRCEGVWPEADPDVDYLRELVVEMGDRFRQDYIAEGTVVGLDNTRNPIRRSTGDYVLDDTETLQAYAQLAYQWYRRPRVNIDINANLDWPLGRINLGDFVTQIKTADNQIKAVNATVTEIAIQYPSSTSDDPGGDLPPPTLSIKTAYGQLDLVHL